MGAPVRIGLRVLANPAWRGGINYVVNWARACALLPPEEKPSIFLLCVDEPSREVAENLRPLVAGIRGFDEARSLGLDLVFPVTQVFEAPFEAPWAGWIPDWQCKYLPEMFDALERARRDLHYGLLATRAPLLALSSRMAINDTYRLFGERLVPHEWLPFPAVLDAAEKAAVAPRAEYDVPERYFVVCNQWWRHKNHRLVLEAMRRLPADAPVCVFTGATTDPRWPEHFAEMRSMITAYGLDARVRVLGAVPRLAQIGLMREAIAVIQPSRFEGWSTVVEEARALGTPLLLSRFPVHLEQAPPGAQFFDPDAPEELAVLMNEAASGRLSPPKGADQSEYVQSCARRLVALARQGRAAYKEERHDPKVLMLDLLRAGSDAFGTPTLPALRERVVAGCRAALRADPAQLAAFQLLSRRGDAQFARSVEAEVIAPTLAKMEPDARARFHAAGGEAPAVSASNPWRTRLRAVANRLRSRP
jgi:glycosyltransferase involved in cell wall biosynthesis